MKAPEQLAKFSGVAVAAQRHEETGMDGGPVQVEDPKADLLAKLALALWWIGTNQKSQTAAAWERRWAAPAEIVLEDNLLPRDTFLVLVADGTNPADAAEMAAPLDR